MTSEPNASAPRPSAGAAGDSSGPKAELARLEAKLAKITDRDIRAVLLIRIQQLNEELASLKPEVPEITDQPETHEEPADEKEPVVEEMIESPTPQQMEAAEKILRQAQVERMRGNKQAVSDLLKQAAAVAPGSWQVLTALGDDAMERRKVAEARDIYAKALKVSPKNVALERKHAEAVFRSAAYVSIEDQLRMGVGESAFVTPEEAMASRTTAMFLNAVLPGMGQIYLGYTTNGVAMLVLWLASLGGIVLLRHDLEALVRFVVGGSGKNLSMIVLIPMLVAAIVYFVAIAGVRGKAHRRHVDRPVPPVNLPYE